MITIIDNVLTSPECDELIELGNPNLKTATTLGENIEGYRTAEGSWLFNNTPLTEKVIQTVSKLTNTPNENQEAIHIVKYEIGGEYKEHHDFFNIKQASAALGVAGQRIKSCLFYLNDDYEGGETFFPIKKIKVTPRKGRLLIWDNVNENGKEDNESLHAGLPVISGTKYIAIIWIRERQFKFDNIKKLPTQKVKVIPNHFDLGKILNEDECKKIADLVINELENNRFQIETDKRYYNNSFGGNIPASYELLDKFLPLVETTIGKGVKPANPYIRVYKNGSTLNRHTDRVGLDWTISLCLFENLNNDWPLIVKDENSNLEKYPTKIGMASLVSGNILEHWREPLECKENEYVIQIFLHYTECGCKPKQ